MGSKLSEGRLPVGEALPSLAAHRSGACGRGPAARGSAPAPLAIGEPRACQVSVSLSHVAKVNRRKPAQTKVPDF